MNVERIQKLRDHLAQLPPERVNIAHWARDPEEGNLEKAQALIHRCGTIGCIGGWTEALFGDPQRSLGIGQTGELLGLDDDQSWELFFPFPQDDEDTNTWRAGISQAETLKVLDHLLATGEVNWSIIR